MAKFQDLLLLEREAQLDCLRDPNLREAAGAVLDWIDKFLDQVEVAVEATDEITGGIEVPDGDPYTEQSSDGSAYVQHWDDLQDTEIVKVS